MLACCKWQENEFMKSKPCWFYRPICVVQSWLSRILEVSAPDFSEKTQAPRDQEKTNRHQPTSMIIKSSI